MVVREGATARVVLAGMPRSVRVMSIIILQSNRSVGLDVLCVLCVDLFVCFRVFQIENILNGAVLVVWARCIGNSVPFHRHGGS